MEKWSLGNGRCALKVAARNELLRRLDKSQAAVVYFVEGRPVAWQWHLTAGELGWVFG